MGFLTAGIIGERRCARVIRSPTPRSSRQLPLPLQARQADGLLRLYPVDSRDYPELKDALAKLQLNDAALTFEPESSAALGFGYRCGFLGLLHMEIIQERLEREFELDLVATAPSVVYRVTTTDGAVVNVDNPAALPPPTKIEKIEEPYVEATIIASDFIGPAWSFAERRGSKSAGYTAPNRALIRYDLPPRDLDGLFDQLERTKATPPSITTSRATKSLPGGGHLPSGDPVDAPSSRTASALYPAGRRLWSAWSIRPASSSRSASRHPSATR